MHKAPLLFLVALVLLLSSQSCADSSSSLPSSNDGGEQTIGDVGLGVVSQQSAGFDIMKKMVGNWEGELTQFTGNVINISSEFRMISGGNTISEKLVEDGVEMLTTYTDYDGKLIVTHYCALGTEPVFKVQSVTDNSLSIVVDEAESGYNPEKENYVNSITWTINDSDPNQMTVDGTVYMDGKLESQRSIVKRVN